MPSIDGDVWLTQAIFSPDNDGYQDVLQISYRFETPDNLMDVVVYDTYGRQIKELKDNFYGGSSGEIIWDGISNDDSKAPIGSYIIVVTVFDLNGNIETYKLVGVLATKF